MLVDISSGGGLQMTWSGTILFKEVTFKNNFCNNLGGGLNMDHIKNLTILNT